MDYISETEMNVLTRELLLLSCSKEMRERGLLKSNLEQKSNENPRAKFERVWEGVSEWELSVRAQNSLLGLYLKREWPGTVGRSWAQRLVAVGKSWKSVVGRWGRPTQWLGRPHPGPTGWQPGPSCSPTVINFEHLGARPNFVSNDVQIYFSKDFNAQKIFLDFHKNRKRC